MVYYVLNALNSHDRLPENGCIVKSIVTSEIGRVIADSFDITTMDTLTGFKFICGKAREFDETGSHTYLLGYEESYGYVVGDFVRDKDAVIASMFISEMAAWYQSKGMTLYEGLLSLWEKYGYYSDTGKSIQAEGKEGMEKIQKLMNKLRDNPPEKVAGLSVLRIEDYKEGKAHNLKDGTTEDIDFPVSNVLKYILEDKAWFCVRPSGTEPKVKFYFSTVAESQQDAEAKNQKLMDAVEKLI